MLIRQSRVHYFHWCQLNTLRLRQNGQHFADDRFSFFIENVRISIKISLEVVPKGPINNIPALVELMAWCRPGVPLSEPMMISSLTHMCITRPQWVTIVVSQITGNSKFCSKACNNRENIKAPHYWHFVKKIHQWCFTWFQVSFQKILILKMACRIPTCQCARVYSSASRVIRSLDPPPGHTELYSAAPERPPARVYLPIWKIQ